MYVTRTMMVMAFSDADEITCGTDPLLPSKPLDTDNDGIANCIDTDDDNDGY